MVTFDIYTPIKYEIWFLQQKSNHIKILNLVFISFLAHFYPCIHELPL